MNKGTYFCHPKSVEWYTPPWIFSTLGLDFDLDPCSPVDGPVTPAGHHFTAHDDGLSREWFGMVWLNPPYGKETGKWLNRMSLHNRGVALIYARTETEFFHRYVWTCASGVFFFRGRLHFIGADGEVSLRNAGGPSCLVAYGQKAHDSLSAFPARGKFINPSARVGRHKSENESIPAGGFRG